MLLGEHGSGAEESLRAQSGGHHPRTEETGVRLLKKGVQSGFLPEFCWTETEGVQGSVSGNARDKGVVCSEVDTRKVMHGGPEKVPDS